jgi:3-hydroxymyristoyl/3-hydroxydecanoyl-(acyl carrier protein) dehydratase
MVDEISSYHPKAGPNGIGFIQGTKRVIPNEWFFAAHFHQDPVMPGSLGLEAFVQLLQVFSDRMWKSDREFQCPQLGSTHEWTYRGQVLPTDAEVTVQAEMTKIDKDCRTLTADGYLTVDGRVIYQMTGFAVQG